MDRSMFDGLLTKKITIGVTGFSRSGKTVFIGALAQALLSSDAWSQRRGQGPLAQFEPFERGSFRSAQIRSDIDSHLPQFPFLKVRNSLVGHNANWPEPTEGISRLTLDLNYLSRGWFKGLRKVRIELVDYPGEWLVDLPMLEQSYEVWSEQMLALASHGLRSEWSHLYFAEMDKTPADQDFDEEVAIRLSETWADYLQKAAAHGLVRNQPGRHLRPDALRHSPVLRLAPLSEQLRSSKLGKGMAKRFEEYKKKVIKPFYSDHFKHIDRQIVLLDVLLALQQGEPAFNELTDALKHSLASFHYGKEGILSWLTGVKITHLLFAATKADHVTRADRANLEQMVRRMLASIDEHNQLRSDASKYDVMALASVRATEDRMTINQPKREILYGQPDEQDKQGQWDPGGLPLDMPPDWSAVHFQFLKFKTAAMPNAMSEGFPAINLGKALNFLIGEDLK